MVFLKDYHTQPKNVLDETSIKGKPVYSPTDEFIGSISHIIIDPLALEIDSFIITKGITKEPIHIGKEFVGRSSKDQITLTVEPSRHWIGKAVFDKEARYVGTVAGVHLRDRTQDYLSLIIYDTQTDQERIIAEKKIHLIGKYVLLDVSILK